MKRSSVLQLISLTMFLFGCHQVQVKTPEETFAEGCKQYGFAVDSKDYSDCVHSAIDAYYKEIERRYLEASKAQKKAQQEALKAQVKADTEQCKQYGFTKGTPDFANCMMQQDQEREQVAIAESQQELTREQMKQQEKWRRYQAIQNSMPVNCSSSTLGGQTNTTCY
jgi:phage gp45-like